MHDFPVPEFWIIEIVDQYTLGLAVTIHLLGVSDEIGGSIPNERSVLCLIERLCR
jgi:hypothetical protein